MSCILMCGILVYHFLILRPASTTQCSNSIAIERYGFTQECVGFSPDGGQLMVANRSCLRSPAVYDSGTLEFLHVLNVGSLARAFAFAPANRGPASTTQCSNSIAIERFCDMMVRTRGRALCLESCAQSAARRKQWHKGRSSSPLLKGRR